MKFLATPILQGDSAEALSIEGDDLTPRRFVDLLDSHKALIFHSPDADLTVEDFGRFVTNLQLTHYPYIGGAAPRTVIPVEAGKDIIFTANER
jgi:hypothetical protein